MEKSEKIKIKSNQFGELEINQTNIFNFPNGILGFEDEKRFILINDEKISPFKWLISIDNSNIGFPIISPWLVNLEFDLGDEFNIEDKIPMVVVNSANKAEALTANLKAPIFFDVKNLQGEQIIIENSRFTTEEKIKEI